MNCDFCENPEIGQGETLDVGIVVDSKTTSSTGDGYSGYASSISTEESIQYVTLNRCKACERANDGYVWYSPVGATLKYTGLIIMCCASTWLVWQIFLSIFLGQTSEMTVLGIVGRMIAGSLLGVIVSGFGNSMINKRLEEEREKRKCEYTSGTIGKHPKVVSHKSQIGLNSKRHTEYRFRRGGDKGYWSQYGF